MKCCQMSDAQFLLNITLKRKYAKGDFQNTIQMRKKEKNVCWHRWHFTVVGKPKCDLNFVLASLRVKILRKVQPNFW